MTQQEKMSAINGKAAEINELKRKLASTDYVVIRAKEQDLTLSADFKAQRQGWRDDINALEVEIAELEETETEDEE